MRKALFTLAAAAIALGVPALSVGAASAASGPSLTCNIQPNEGDAFGRFCGSGVVADEYAITYLVQGVTGTASYAWTVPSEGTVADGCTSTSDICVIDTRAQGLSLTASVVVTQGGSSTTLSSTAILPD
jgi:PKD-like domain